jgi:hypothetical protein
MRRSKNEIGREESRAESRIITYLREVALMHLTNVY